MSRIIQTIFMALVALSASLNAHVTPELRAAVQSGNPKEIDLALQNMAARYFRKIDTKKNLKLVTRSEFLRTAYYIERHLEAKSFGSTAAYYNKSKTKLPLSFEHDPAANTTFIHLDGKKGAMIGAGAAKTVTRAILYAKHAEIVAKAAQTRDMTRELKLTKMLQGSVGIFDTKGFSTTSRKAAIYSKLYNAGSLQDVFDRKERFSLWEKAKMATSLISGLKAMQEKGIVHRDLGCRNYLVHIPSGKAGKRHVDAVVADLGRAVFAKDSIKDKVQGNTSYTSPEGLFRYKMKGSDYYKSDIFAVGNVLYQLFYEKKPAWQENSWVKDEDIPLHSRYYSMVNLIKQKTESRFKLLAHKEHSGRVLTPSEEFEYLILKMVNPNPDERPKATKLHKDMQKIFNQIR
jgi:serine/threonine protein kinase